MTPAYKRKIWQYEDADTDKFNFLIETVHQKKLLETSNSVEIYHGIFKIGKGMYIPEKTTMIIPKDKLWFDSVIRKFI